VPEVLRPGVTGLIASGIDDLVRAAAQIGKLSRQDCREVFEQRFTSEVMAANYERVYYRLIDERRKRGGGDGQAEGRWTQAL
jgi:glycosyltransferase involved in cell wall biosynthesis